MKVPFPFSSGKTLTPALSGSTGQGSRRAGFTLLELLVAMTITAIIAASLYSSLRIGFRAEAAAEAAVEPVRTAELAMGLLRPDLESAVTPSGELQGAFTGTDGTDGAFPADSLSFYTLGDPLEPPAGIQIAAGPAIGSGTGLSGIAGGASHAPANLLPGTGEVRMVTLGVRTAATGNVLVRAVTTNLLAETIEPPPEEVVCRGVRSFNLRYFDGSGWQDGWDSTTVENATPTAVEVTIELVRPGTGAAELAAGEPRATAFTRIFLLSCSALWTPATGTTGTTGTGTSTGAAGGTGQ